MKCCQAFGVLYDKRIPHKLKGKFYRTSIRLTTLYSVAKYVLTVPVSTVYFEPAFSLCVRLIEGR
jgi:hypothetical protein